MFFIYFQYQKYPDNPIHLKKTLSSISGVSKLRPAGQIRLEKPFHQAREVILLIMKKQYNHEKFVDFVEYNTSRNNHIT